MLTRENLKEILVAAGNADTAADAMVRLNDEAQALFADYDRVVSESSAKDERIRNLQDTNQSLFLRVTGTTTEEEDNDEDKAPEELLADLTRMIRGDK